MKYFLNLIVVLVLFFGGFNHASAITNCDDQAKPAFSCPPGYSVMCSSGGGNYHWACGKESRGAIIEASPISSTEEATNINTLREVEPAVSTLEACQAKCREDYGGSGSAGFDACMRACGAGGSLKTVPLPTIQEPEKEELKQFEPKLLTPILLKSVEVRGWDPAKKEEFLRSVKNFAEIKSGKDLENFARGVLLRDENINSAIVNEEEVLVSYKMPAKFIGLFDSSLGAEINVNSDGEVKVKYPWYGLFFKKPVSAIQIQEGVGEEIKSIKQTMQTQVRLQDILQKQSQVLQTISNVSKMLHDTATSVIRKTQ